MDLYGFKEKKKLLAGHQRTYKDIFFVKPLAELALLQLRTNALICFFF